MTNQEVVEETQSWLEIILSKIYDNAPYLSFEENENFMHEAQQYADKLTEAEHINKAR